MNYANTTLAYQYSLDSLYMASLYYQYALDEWAGGEIYAMEEYTKRFFQLAGYAAGHMKRALNQGEAIANTYVKGNAYLCTLDEAIDAFVISTDTNKKES